MPTQVTVKNRTWTLESGDFSWCPTCKAPEMHPDGDKLLIRGNKVYDNEGCWSQCLVCSGYYDDDLNCPDKWAKTEGGWFVE